MNEKVSGECKEGRTGVTEGNNDNEMSNKNVKILQPTTTIIIMMMMMMMTVTTTTLFQVIFHVFIDVMGMMKLRRRRHVAEEPGLSMWAAVGKSPPENADRLMLWARGGYAGLVLLFVVAYWTVVLVNMDY